MTRDEHIQLSSGPRENGHRPAIDPLFRSVARTFGPRVIAIVLSGSLDDGAAGARFVRERGGAVVVQEPEDALYSAMPLSAIGATEVDHVVAVDDMAGVVCRLLEEPLDRALEEEAALASEELDDPTDGDPSGLTCPECGGALWQVEEGSIVRFACRTGHAYSPDSLVQEQSKALEAALWSALRGLEERADLFRRMARRASGTPGMARRFESRARAVEEHAGVVSHAIDKLGPGIEPEHESEPAV